MSVQQEDSNDLLTFLIQVSALCSCYMLSFSGVRSIFELSLARPSLVVWLQPLHVFLLPLVVFSFWSVSLVSRTSGTVYVGMT